MPREWSWNDFWHLLLFKCSSFPIQEVLHGIYYWIRVCLLFSCKHICNVMLEGTEELLWDTPGFNTVYLDSVLCINSFPVFCCIANINWHSDENYSEVQCWASWVRDKDETFHRPFLSELQCWGSQWHQISTITFSLGLRKAELEVSFSFSLHLGEQVDCATTQELVRLSEPKHWRVALVSTERSICSMKTCSSLC